jgi:PST family polysaccharide transporter
VIASTLRRRLRQIKRSELQSNALSLYANQGLNYLVPLIVLPYLVRILGPSGYGSIGIAQSLMGYAIVLTDFGFNLTAARDISVARHDTAAVSRIYWTTMAAKLLLLGISMIIVAGTVLILPSFRHDWLIFLACTPMVFGNLGFPQWYLQGLERLKDSAAIQASTKIAGGAATFVFVHSSSDVCLAALISSAPQLLGVGAALIWRKPLMPENFYRPTFDEVRRSLAGNWHVFASSISTTLYGITNTMVLGLISGPSSVGIYSFSQRLVTTIQGLAVPLTQAVSPRASMLFDADRDGAWKLMARLVKVLFPTVGACALLLGLFAPTIVGILGGPSMMGAVPLVRILAITPVFIAVGALPAQIILVSNGRTADLFRIYLRVGIANILIMPILVYQYSALGAAWSLTISEAFATGQMVWLALRDWRAQKPTRQ